MEPEEIIQTIRTFARMNSVWYFEVPMPRPHILDGVLDEMRGIGWKVSVSSQGETMRLRRPFQTVDGRQIPPIAVSEQDI